MWDRWEGQDEPLVEDKENDVSSEVPEVIVVADDCRVVGCTVIKNGRTGDSYEISFSCDFG